MEEKEKSSPIEEVNRKITDNIIKLLDGKSFSEAVYLLRSVRDRLERVSFVSIINSVNNLSSS
jgi:hypothetical protein